MVIPEGTYLQILAMTASLFMFSCSPLLVSLLIICRASLDPGSRSLTSGLKLILPYHSRIHFKKPSCSRTPVLPPGNVLVNCRVKGPKMTDTPHDPVLWPLPCSSKT